MKIAYITAVYPPTRGGMCTVAGAEARALGRDHDVTVFTLSTDNPDQDEAYDKTSPVPVVRLRGFPRIAISAFVPQLIFLLRGFDAVYAHLPAYGFFEVIALWKLITRKRLIVTAHMDPIGTGLVYKIGFTLQKISYRTVLFLADAIRVSTNRLRSAPFLDTPRIQKKISVIPFGISLSTFHPAPQKTGHVYVFVGRLSKTHYFKGVDLLIRSFKAVTQVDSDSELWIVGDGEERVRYEQLAQKLRIHKRVRFLGAVSDFELPSVYRNASVMVLPSTDTSETFGLVLLEAMASGVPVIASNLPGVDELVEHGATGVLIDPGSQASLEEALCDASTQRNVWLARGKSARERAEAYGDWTIIAKRISALL